MAKVVVLQGEQGSGKGTLGRALQQTLGGLFVSAGDLLRAAGRLGGARGIAIAERIDEGLGVPPALAYALLADAVGGLASEPFLFLDGYPRRVNQVDLLARTVGSDPHLVLVLHVPTVITVARLLSRLTCRDCGRVYGPVVPPRVAAICDGCGGEIEHREDDNADGIKRRQHFWRRHGPLIVRYYEQRELASHVDATGLPDVVRDLALDRINSS
jgi:adenylate kinase